MQPLTLTVFVQRRRHHPQRQRRPARATRTRRQPYRHQRRRTCRHDRPRSQMVFLTSCRVTCVQRMHCPNRPGLSVQEGPLPGACWAAANVPPTTFALSTRARVGALRPPLARPMISSWPKLTTHKAALCPSPLPCPSPLLCTTTSWVQPAPVSHSRSCCAPVRAFP
jgi:hypothetical protein